MGAHTDEVLEELGKAGRDVTVICPGFSVDCLETLEELGLRAREDFAAAGGEELVLAPALNSDPRWVAAAAGLVRKAAGAFD